MNPFLGKIRPLSVDDLTAKRLIFTDSGYVRQNAEHNHGVD